MFQSTSHAGSVIEDTGGPDPGETGGHETEVLDTGGLDMEIQAPGFDVLTADDDHSPGRSSPFAPSPAASPAAALLRRPLAPCHPLPRPPRPHARPRAPPRHRPTPAGAPSRGSPAAARQQGRIERELAQRGGREWAGG